MHDSMERAGVKQHEKEHIEVEVKDSSAGKTHGVRNKYINDTKRVNNE